MPAEDLSLYDDGMWKWKETPSTSRSPISALVELSLLPLPEEVATCFRRLRNNKTVVQGPYIASDWDGQADR